jgi:hypothetical protein
MKRFTRPYWPEVIGALLGGIIGFVYWRHVGCLSGQCAITSSPVKSTMYFMVLGWLLVQAFKKSKKETI